MKTIENGYTRRFLLAVFVFYYICFLLTGVFSSGEEMAALFAKPAPRPIGRDGVYVAAVPLRATKGPAQLFASLSYSLNLWNLQHFMVIISPVFSLPDSQLLVYDFQPKDPENLQVAVAALSGRSIPGVVLQRKMRKLPRKKCWYVGTCKQNGVDIACKFNQKWDTNLRISKHDCRDYTNGLVEELTSAKNVIDHLRESSPI